MVDLTQFLVKPSAPIREVIACIDRNAKGIALAVDEDRRLLFTITDGDIRRALLRGVSMEAPVRELEVWKAGTAYPAPVTASAATDRNEILQRMQQRHIRQLPLLDAAERVVDIVTLDEFVPDQLLPLEAVVMAGGMGTRLRPLTDDLPKPMLPVGDRPLLQVIIDQFRQAGIRRVNIATHYKRDKIVDYFGDGDKFGVSINYLDEESPLGTAGALGLMEPSTEPVLVINGDIMTRIDFRTMLAYHRKHQAELTLAVRPFNVSIPYGVVECDGPLLRNLREKPMANFLVNAGIYLLEPSVLADIPKGTRFDMTDLIQRLLAAGRPVASFPVLEYWLDIGQFADYQQAQQDIQQKGWAS